MNYLIKIGNMFVDEVITREDQVKTHFIYKIVLYSKKNVTRYKPLVICEEEKEKYREILTEVLDLKSGNPNDIITFEEFEEEEEEIE